MTSNKLITDKIKQLQNSKNLEYEDKHNINLIYNLYQTQNQVRKEFDLERLKRLTQYRKEIYNLKNENENLESAKNEFCKQIERLKTENTLLQRSLSIINNINTLESKYDTIEFISHKGKLHIETLIRSPN